MRKGETWSDEFRVKFSATVQARPRQCLNCGLESDDLELFKPNKNSSRGVMNLCREYDKADSRTRLAKTRDWITKIKAEAPCQDCGGVFPPECMDFDHVRGKKPFSLGSRLALKYKWETVTREIEKCDLVCANCHRIRTTRRRQNEEIPIYHN